MNMDKINDECKNCGDVLECELFKQGHQKGNERKNVAKMIECQMIHKEKRLKEK